MRISPLHRTVAAVVVGTVALSAVVAFAREDDRPSAAPPRPLRRPRHRRRGLHGT